MDKKLVITLIIGFIICGVLFFIDLYLGAIAVVIMATVVLSVSIMEDARILPDVVLRLQDNAKAINLTNSGNAMAYKIHITLVPHNIELNIKSLAPDSTLNSNLDFMITEAKAVVEFEDQRGLRYSRIYRLSALGKSDDDLLKPAFPLFRWK